MRVTDEFLTAVEADGDWDLILRKTGGVAETVKARNLWEQVGHAAWSCADPGIQFHTTINDWHTCPAAGEIHASNPCSEYMFLDDTACNLASLNLMAFRDDDGSFDVENYEHAIRLWTIVLEIAVTMAQFPSRQIAQLSYEYRTLGLGYANIGGLLMAAGIPYDSDEGRALGGALSAIMTGVSYATSAEMARELGSFPGYEANREPMLRVIRNHARAARAKKGAMKTCPPRQCRSTTPLAPTRDSWRMPCGPGIRRSTSDVSTVIATRRQRSSRRPARSASSWTATRPESNPNFALVKFKKLAGGGHFKIINQMVPQALKTLGYDDEEIKRHECGGPGLTRWRPRHQSRDP